MVNYKLVIICFCIFLGSIFYLFYWNRVVAFVLGSIFRFLFWDKGESSIWFDIGSIQFSILGGKILFKDLCYHSSNQTIRIVKGHISWRYWIRAPASQEDLLSAKILGADLSSGQVQNAKLSCRLHAYLQGIEWFIYNRTTAYENIISSMQPDIAAATAEPTDARMAGENIRNLRKIFSWNSAVPDSTHPGPPVSLMSSMYSRTPAVMKNILAWGKRQLPQLDPKDLLPLGLEVDKAAIICGNDSTPSLLVVEFRRATGSYGIVPSRCKLDLYKQLLNLTFLNASVHYVDNDNYKESMRNSGEKLQSRIQSAGGARPLHPLAYLPFSAFSVLWRKFKLWNPISLRLRSKSMIAHTAAQASSWGRRKPKKSDEEETPIGADFSTIEYAKENKVLEAPVLEMLYYADAVGIVPNDARPNCPVGEDKDPLDIGNGDLPPEWGIDLAIRGGFLRYGPWADRQRAVLQQTFFPPDFSEAIPQPSLKPGDSRVWTCMKILVELRDGVVVQIPFRESSKDWQWDREVKLPYPRPRKREAASIHIRAGDNSTISYMMPMIATAQGYEPVLNVHLDTVTVTSSLNDIRLLTADSCVVRCELPSPLIWNAQRKWTFAVSLRHPIFFLLRDHVNMFTDLGKDWSSGPPSDYNRFIPMLYILDIDLQNYDLNTYVNDHNIIDKPLILEENALLTLRGPKLKTTVQIPFTKYRPDSTCVSFCIEAPGIDVSLTLPRWNTHSLYATPHRSSDIGHIGWLRLDASYRYFDDIHPENIDQLRLDFSVRDMIYRACGWTIRYFMVFRNNYFGSFTHFTTLYEYINKRKLGLSLGDPVDSQYREGSTNAMQVQMGVNVQNGLLILPCGLPGYEIEHGSRERDECDIGTSLMVVFPELQIQLRTHDYYMEMSLNVDSFTGTIHKHCSENLRLARTRLAATKEKFILDGLDIVAHRLFGPPPLTTTYLCVWEIHIESFKGNINTLDVQILAAAGRTFGLSFTDPLNAPAGEYEVPVDPDVTFVKVSLDTLNVIWDTGLTAVELKLPYGLRFDTNDVAGERYSKVGSIRVPDISVKVLLATEANPSTWSEVLEFTGGSNIDMYFAPPDWQEKARLQREFLAKQDSTTKRATFLYLRDKLPNHDQIKPGRISDLSTDFYLPQLRIPKYNMTHRSAYRVPVGTPKPLNRSLRRQPIHYESDGEENVSEIDRDTRLAKSRPLIPLLDIASDDSSMSSGDESDNEDLTGPYQSESDTSNISEEVTSKQWPSVREYSRLSRSYKTRQLDRPGFWGESPFYLFQERVFKPKTCFGHDLDEEVPLSSPQMYYDFDHSVDTIIVRIDSIQGANIWLSPLIIPATQHLMTDISSSQMSPELLVDAVIAQHVHSFSAARSKGSATVLDINLSSILLRSVQVISSSDREIGKNRELATPEDEDEDEAETSGCSVDLMLRGISFKHRHIAGDISTPSLRSLTASFNFFGLCLTRETDVLEMPLRFTIGISSLFTTGSALSVSLGDTKFEVMPTAPGATMAVGVVLNKLINGLLVTNRDYLESTGASDELVIYRTIQLARKKDIRAVDPLSTTQPSYLVQKGTPNDIRTDTAFKYMLYLRMCLQHLDELERLSLVAPSPPDLVPSDIKDALEGQLHHFAEDTQRSMDLRRSIFHQVVSDVSTALPQPSPFLVDGDISLKLSRFHLLLPHNKDNLCSEFLVGPLVITSLLRLTESSQAPGLGPTKSTTTLTLRDKPGHNLEQIALVVSVGDVLLAVYPQLIDFLQSAIRTTKQHRCYMSAARTSPVTDQPGQSVLKQISMIYADVVLTTRSLRFKAGAENLLVEYKATDVGYASTILLIPPLAHRPAWESSMNHSLAFGELKLQACAVADLVTKQEYSVLASIVVGGGKINVLYRQEHSASTNLRLVMGLDFVRFSVPRSAIRLYRFMEEWRADYLPGIDATVRSLLSELKKSPVKSRSLSSRASDQHTPLALQIQADVTSIRVSLQVMRGTWLSWEIDHSMAYFTAPTATHKTRTKGFGLRIGSQTFSISSGAHYHDATPDVRVKLALPSISVTGRHDGRQIHGLALVEYFHWTVKPTHWDTLLSVQQKSGQDFNDLLSLIAKTSSKGPVKPKTTATNSTPWGYNVQVKMKGFQIGLEGLASTLLLECDHIGGVVSKSMALNWHVELSDLSLSLASHSRTRTMNSTLYRDRRAAFVIIDLRVDMADNPTGKNIHMLNVSVTKIHAVMQPSSIGQLGDFVDQLQAEVLARKEKRAQELAEFKEKTRSLMRTLEVGSFDSQTENFSWMDQYVIRVKIRNVGVAFPLTLNRDLHLPRAGSQHDEAVRAFLFSIKSIGFGFERSESGQASMKGFSFQFVARFRQSMYQDFAGENHPTRNRLLYPEMTAQLRSDRPNGTRRTRISAEVDGFVLDVDSAIPDNISSLIEVYRQGKDRVDKLTAAIPRDVSTSDTVVISQTSPVENGYDVLPSSNIFSSLTFRSGRVRMYSQASAQASRTRTLSQPLHDATDEQIRELGAEVFKLPVVTVWGEYRTAQVTDNLRRTTLEPSTLLFKGTVHSSQNTLRPTLLPFLTEVINNTEMHMRKANLRESRSRPSSLASLPAPFDLHTSSVPEEPLVHPSDSTSALRISLSLRIDQSKLELTCQPDVNVIAGLNWDSGGFVVNISPGARRVTFTGSVGGLTAGLKHGFLSEDCVRLRAKDLAFTVDLSKSLESNMSSVSVICDTEFSGGVRFSRLQDILCFKAVWLDRIPIFSAQPATPATPRPKPANPITPSVSQQPKQEFTTVLLLRLREVSLDVDLGQSISSIHLNLNNSVLRTKMSEAVSEVSLSVRELKAVATGNLSGRLSVPDFLFQTVRRASHSSDDVSKDRMLDLFMTSGPLDIELDSEYQRLLLYRAEPLVVTIHDDWSLFKPGVPVTDRRVRLTFNVIGSSLMAVMNVGTIPKLVSYGNKFNTNMDAQREGAARESQAFRISSSPKPDNPLSEVANAMFSSARSKFVESEPGILCVVSQRLSLKLSSLRLVIFPRSMRDPELAQFIGADIHARLDRVVKSDVLPPERDLRLSFSSIGISKLSQLNHVLVSKDKPTESQEWFALLTKDALEATIFSLPSMDMRMHSDEFLQDSARVLPYDFSSKFIAQQGPQNTEDIYITLNMSLYSWLTILRRTFAREMEQTQAAAEVRAPTVGVVQSTARQRRTTHIPDPLIIDFDPDNPRPPRLTESPEPWSPPTSAKRLSLQHTKTAPARNLNISPLSANMSGFGSPAVSTVFQSPASPAGARFISPAGPSPVDDYATANTSPGLPSAKKAAGITYQPRDRHIERLTMRQLGEATPDVMHPFFMKTAGFSLEDSLPQYVHEYATMPTEEIMKALLKLYSKQLKIDDVPNSKQRSNEVISGLPV